MHWWASDPLDASATPSGAALQAWVYDAFSQRLLGHHTWLPSKAQRASGKWLEPWAKALAGSEVAPYMRIDPVTALLEQRGDGLRIFATLPGQEHRVEGPLLKAAFNTPADAVLVTVRHPGNQALLHHALFRPQDCEAAPKNQTTWVEELAGFIQGQKWPELEVKDYKQVWVQLSARNLHGVPQEWGAGQYKLNKLSKALHADKAEANTPVRIGNLLNNLHFSKNSYKEYLSTRKLVSEMELTEIELGGLCIIPTLSIKQEILKGASQNMLKSYTADADEDLFKMIYASLNAARLVSTDDKEALSPNAGQAATQAAAARIVEKSALILLMPCFV
ncbi:hypothetical protein ACX0KM_23170 [Pseudomonas promysalinigenes]